ncbi:MAG TPA: AMP-binding protein [Pseudonocardiaceae bacterium]|jgi:cyclohexanecarboxylate-CoA ligase/acyl-CoA synthetase
MSTVDIGHAIAVTDRYSAESIDQFRARNWWRDGSAAALLDHWAELTPTKRFISDGTVELDYATTREHAHSLAATLLHRGVTRGDRVLVQLPNWAEFVVSYLAISRLGAVMVPVMMVYRETELTHVLANSGAVAVITTGRFRSFDHAAMFRALRVSTPALTTLVIARADAVDDEVSFDEACAAPANVADFGEYPDPDAPHLIVYTSGTESTAKGCVHTWNTANFSGHGLATDVFEVTPDDVMFMPSPVAHATGLVVGVLVPLAVGAETHLLDIWEPNEGLKRISRYRCTATATATPFVRMALDAAAGSDHDLSSMRFWLCAGAPIPEALAREFHETFTGGALMPLYGCTEVLAATCCHTGDPVERRSGSDGSPALAGIRIKLADIDGADAPPGEEGEICYWGPGAVLGYWHDPARTKATIDADGWHHTGDLGRLDADGYLRVTGRLKDIIIRGGTNISAAEVEGHVISHPDVSQVAVVGYPDERLGERACAVVVPKKGRAPTLADITGFLRTERHIAPHKLPERLVLVDELPITASGKVQKFKLRQTAAGQS